MPLKIQRNISLENVDQLSGNWFTLSRYKNGNSQLFFSFSETMIPFLLLPLATRIQPLATRYVPYICLSYITQSSFMGSSALYWISIHPPSSVQSEELLKRNPKACDVRNDMTSIYQWYQQSVAYFVIIQIILRMTSTHCWSLVVLALYC